MDLSRKELGPLRVAEEYKVIRGEDEEVMRYPNPTTDSFLRHNVKGQKKDSMKKREVCFLWIPQVFVVV